MFICLFAARFGGVKNKLYMLLHVRKKISSPLAHTRIGEMLFWTLCAKCNSRVSPYYFEIPHIYMYIARHRLQFEKYSILWGHLVCGRIRIRIRVSMLLPPKVGQSHLCCSC